MGEGVKGRGWGERRGMQSAVEARKAACWQNVPTGERGGSLLGKDEKEAKAQATAGEKHTYTQKLRDR